MSTYKRVLWVVMLAVSVAASTQAAEPTPDEMTSLPDYLAMDRKAQLQLILDTKRVVMRKIAQTDYVRAKCVVALFDWTDDGRQQLYDTKGLLEAAAVQRPSWKAEQVITFRIEHSLCPETGKNTN